MLDLTTAELWAEMNTRFAAGDLVGAETAGNQILQVEPRNVRALHLLSLVANRRKEPDRELQLLHAALAIDPGDAPALVGMAKIARAQGRPDEAIQLCRAALLRQPFSAMAHNTIGLCRLAQRKPIEAAKSFNLAIAYEPRLAAGRQNLSAALAHLGPNSQRALEPVDAEDFENFGWLLLFLRKPFEAMDMFQRALELAPMSAKLLKTLAEQLRQHGESGKSIELWERLIAIDPNDARYHSGLGYACQDVGDFARAGDEFERSLALNPNQGDAHLGRVTSRKITPADHPWLQTMRDLVQDDTLAASERAFLFTALSKCEDDLGEYASAIHDMDEVNHIHRVESGLTPRFDSEAYTQRLQSNRSRFTQAFFESERTSAATSDRPVFLVGLPRSGTTLTEQMLSRHPEIAAGGELPFWSDQELTCEGGLSQLIADPEAASDVAEEYLQLLYRLDPNAHHVTDKMPDNFVYVGFLHAAFPNAKFIHCRRDPLDNCVSLYMTPFRNRPPMATTREDILFYFRGYQELMSHWESVVPSDRLLTLDYESVITDRETQLRRVIDFLGLTWNDAVLHHEQNRRPVNTPSAWQSRQPIYSSSIGRWRNYEPWLGVLETLKS